MSNELISAARAAEADTAAKMIEVINALLAAKELGTTWQATAEALSTAPWMMGQSEYRQEVLTDLFGKAQELGHGMMPRLAKEQLTEARYLIRFA